MLPDEVSAVCKSYGGILNQWAQSQLSLEDQQHQMVRALKQLAFTVPPAQLLVSVSAFVSSPGLTEKSVEMGSR